MKKQHKQILPMALIAILLMMNGCSHKKHVDPIGTIIVKPSWNICSAIPNIFKIKVNDAYLNTHIGDYCDLGEQFEVGMHQVYIYNEVSNIAISGTVATVATNSTQASVIQSATGFLSTGMEQVVVEAEGVHEVTVNAKQRVREVTLTVTPEGNKVNAIKAITGYLIGVAGSYDMNTDAYSTASKVPLYFTQTESGKWQATVHIMGIVGNEQLLKTYTWYDEPNTPGGPIYPVDKAQPRPGKPATQGTTTLPETANSDPNDESTGIPPVISGTDDPNASSDEKMVIDLGGENEFNKGENCSPIEIGNEKSGSIIIHTDPVNGIIRVNATAMETYTYTVEVSEQGAADVLYTEKVTGTSNALNHNFSAGKYEVFAWYGNHISRNKYSFTANSIEGGYLATDIALMAGSGKVHVYAEGEHIVELAMLNHVRKVVFVLEPEYDEIAQIESITGILTNVAGTYNLSTNSYSNASEIQLNFTKETDDNWSATVYLLGIMPSGAHDFSAMVTYTGGNPSDTTIDPTDLTDKLGEFNANKDDTLTLTGTLVTPASGSFKAGIKDWEAGEGGHAIAN